MKENKQNLNFIDSLIGFLLLLTLLISLFAWITYGTIEGVLGALAYTIVGLLNVFPWLIPFIGIPLGIIDSIGIYGFGMYNLTLNLARINSSWMTFVWFWTINSVGSALDLILMYLIISWIKNLNYRKKKSRTNIALVNCNIVDGNLKNPIIKRGIVLIKNIVEEGEIAGLISGVGISLKLQSLTSIDSSEFRSSKDSGRVLSALHPFKLIFFILFKFPILSGRVLRESQ